MRVNTIVETEQINVQEDAVQMTPNKPKTTEEINEIMKFLKTVVVDDININLLKIRLTETAEHRMKMVKIPKMDFWNNSLFFLPSRFGEYFHNNNIF